MHKYRHAEMQMVPYCGTLEKHMGEGWPKKDFVEYGKKIIFRLIGCPKKKGISDCCSVCPTAQLIMTLELSFLIHLKIRIHMFVASTEPFLSDIREPRHRFFKYPT